RMCNAAAMRVLPRCHMAAFALRVRANNERREKVVCLGCFAIGKAVCIATLAASMLPGRGESRD
ncbi:hypothetical protein E5Q_06643, partial [Mixia osmundae IAM 14324]